MCIRDRADPNFSLDSSDGVYIVFLCIGIIGYFTIPTVAGWIIQAGGMGGYGRNVNQTAGRAGSKMCIIDRCPVSICEPSFLPMS